MHEEKNQITPSKNTGSNEYFYTVVRIPTWELARNCGKYLHKGWVFRGQADATWLLSSTIERSAKRQNYDMPKLIHNSEDFMLNQFIRRAHHYLHDPPKEERKLEWLSLIQHHGGPTRLLDFSRSFYIASFFAVENTISNFVVWAVNSSKLVEQFQNAHQLNKRLKKFSLGKLIEEAMDRAIGKTDQNKMILPVEPFRINERMSIQKGLFLTHMDISTSFIENLAESFGQPVSIFKSQEEKEITSPKGLQMQNLLGVIIKMIIPINCRKAALDDLLDMNISPTSLFPGLDGFARSLHSYFSIFQQSPEESDKYFSK
jgi:hypothetical protein